MMLLTRVAALNFKNLHFKSQLDSWDVDTDACRLNDCYTKFWTLNYHSPTVRFWHETASMPPLGLLAN